MTVVDVAYMVGKTERTIRNWMDMKGFPRPVDRLWERRAVEEWCRANGVRVNNPRGW